jgi:hypothetical protein
MSPSVAPVRRSGVCTADEWNRRNRQFILKVARLGSRAAFVRGLRERWPKLAAPRERQC